MPQTPEHPIEKREPEETLEFLKRNEVRTMAKDVAQLREQQVRTEREKIVSLREIQQSETKTEVQPPPPITPASPSGRPSSAPKEIPLRRLTHFDKVFIRVALVLGITFILINIAAFTVWNVRNTKEQSVPPPAPAQESPLTPSLLPQEPVSFLPIERTVIIELQESGDPLATLSGFFAPPGLTGVFFRNLSDGSFFSLREVLEKSRFKLAPKLTQEGMVFFSVFPIQDGAKQERTRIGFAAKLQDDPTAANDLLQTQEATLEQDVSSFLSFGGQKGQGYVPFFRTTAHKGVSIRFQTFSVQDFGICYAVVGDKLVFTTSLESMKQIIDLLVSKQ